MADQINPRFLAYKVNGSPVDQLIRGPGRIFARILGGRGFEDRSELSLGHSGISGSRPRTIAKKEGRKERKKERKTARKKNNKKKE